MNKIMILNNMSKPKHTFFLSLRSGYCQQFLEELKKTPFFKEFRFVSVDPVNGKLPPLPPYVKSVPTLVIDGEKQARTTLHECMNWLSEERLRHSAATPAALVEIGNDGLLPFAPDMETSGDEQFSYLHEMTPGRLVGTMRSIHDMEGMGQPHELQGQGQGSSSAPVGGKGVSEKAQILDDRMKAMLQMRDMDAKAQQGQRRF